MLQCCSVLAVLTVLVAVLAVLQQSVSCRVTCRVESRVVSSHVSCRVTCRVTSHESQVNVLGVMRCAVLTPFMSQVSGPGQQQQQQVPAVQCSAVQSVAVQRVQCGSAASAVRQCSVLVQYDRAVTVQYDSAV